MFSEKDFKSVRQLMRDGFEDKELPLVLTRYGKPVAVVEAYGKYAESVDSSKSKSVDVPGISVDTDEFTEESTLKCANCHARDAELTIYYEGEGVDVCKRCADVKRIPESERHPLGTDFEGA